jgi:sulfite reductase beta subunit-like hemoprotein
MRPSEQQHREALTGHADRLARFLRGEVPNDSWRPIRLSYGLYYQLDHTSHMQRIKIPGGLLTADQLDAMAEISDLYGRGIAHVTTRQDIQIHWVPLDRIIDLYERLLAVDITTRGACADSVRNVTGCPYAGVHPDEPFDVTPYVMAIHNYFLFNPLNLTLPRKFKIAVEGCPADCAQVPVNDIGLYAKVRDGVRGFAVWAGGGLGAQPFLAQPIADYVPADDVLIWCEAIVRVQHRHGERKNRSRARMKYVVKRMGLDGFRQVVEDEMRRVDAERGDELRTDVREQVAGYPAPPPAAAARPEAAPGPGFEAWRRTNVRAQRQAGHHAVVVQLPLGDITSEQMRALSGLVRWNGNGTLRTTNDQNLVLPSVPAAALPAVHAALVEMGLGNADAGTLVDVVSCPGMDYCSLAITRSMGVAERVRAHLLDEPATGDGFPARLGSFTIKVSGCPNSCGQHHVGDIGLTGHSVTEADGSERPYYSILVGGSVGEGKGRIGQRLGRFPEQDTPAAIAGLARFFEERRQAGETFPLFVDRIGLKELAKVAARALEARAS